MFESPVRKKGVSENLENGSREGYVMTLAKAAAPGVRGREAGRKLRSRHHEREHHLKCDTNIDAKHIASCFPSLSFLLFFCLERCVGNRTEREDQIVLWSRCDYRSAFLGQ